MAVGLFVVALAAIVFSSGSCTPMRKRSFAEETLHPWNLHAGDDSRRGAAWGIYPNSAVSKGSLPLEEEYDGTGFDPALLRTAVRPSWSKVFSLENRAHPWQNYYDGEIFQRESKRDGLWDILKSLRINTNRYKPMRFGAGVGRK